MRILKYPLPMSGRTQISMSKTARLLAVQNQSENLVLWALVSDDDPLIVWRTFHAVLTGEEIAPEIYRRYVGTTQFLGGSYVVHVFEEGQ